MVPSRQVRPLSSSGHRKRDSTWARPGSRVDAGDQAAVVRGKNGAGEHESLGGSGHVQLDVDALVHLDAGAVVACAAVEELRALEEEVLIAFLANDVCRRLSRRCLSGLGSFGPYAAEGVHRISLGPRCAAVARDAVGLAEAAFRMRGVGMKGHVHDEVLVRELVERWKPAAVFCARDLDGLADVNCELLVVVRP